MQSVSTAAVITLSNGDRVTGEVVQTTGDKLVVKSELMGDVTVAWAAITGIESSDKLYFSSQDGQVLVGPVTTSAGAFTINTENSGRVTVPKAEIAYVRNQAAQEAHDAEIERLKNPKLTDFWRGFFDTNLALTTGNSETMSFANAAGMTRETKRDTIKLYFNSIYARQSTTGESVATANAIRGGTRYELNVTDRMFTFGFVDLEYDRFQDLDLRNVIGGGFGYHVKKTERMKFDLFGGATYNQEFFTNDLTRRSAEIVVGEEFDYKLNDRTSFTERLAFYPNMSETGEYRLQFDSSLVTDVFKWMAWNITFSDRFISNPAPGRQQNDVLLTTGIRLVFGGEKLR
jgi:putative salt-induced outer membrane protein YdiY